MVKVLGLFGNPVDGRAFDAYFAETHRPLLCAIPGLEALQIDRVAGSLIGEPPFHLVVELCFGSEAAMQHGLNSDAGQSMARDFGKFASGGVTILLCRSSAEPLDGAIS